MEEEEGRGGQRMLGHKSLMEKRKEETKKEEGKTLYSSGQITN